MSEWLRVAKSSSFVVSWKQDGENLVPDVSCESEDEDSCNYSDSDTENADSNNSDNSNEDTSASLTSDHACNKGEGTGDQPDCKARHASWTKGAKKDKGIHEEQSEKENKSWWSKVRSSFRISLFSEHTYVIIINIYMCVMCVVCANMMVMLVGVLCVCVFVIFMCLFRRQVFADIYELIKQLLKDLGFRPIDITLCLMVLSSTSLL